ncbi:TPR-like protein [Calocera viscosa TUFC12733]|uniref:TPR-like protein n=1 Tax=Calocera viscosa (strain TUFC12733) TaxID=1330018 RepID=A0A167IPI6_CALVF|nr:TPR-like protein [Calocera viscosa TUFC12733]
MAKKKSTAPKTKASNGTTSPSAAGYATVRRLTCRRELTPAQKRPRRDAGDGETDDEAEVDHLAGGKKSAATSPVDGKLRSPLSTHFPETSASPAPQPIPTPSLSAAELKDKGNAEFKKGRYEAAIEWYTKAISAEPSEPTYLTNRAAAYIAQKRFAPALADCQRAHSLQSASPSAKTLLRLAKCQLALGDTAAALSSVGQVLTLVPGEKSAKEMEARIGRVDQHLQRFQQAKSKGEGTLSRISLQEAERESEGFGEGTRWRCWRVEALISAGRLDEAAQAVMDAARVDRESTEVLYLRGLVLFLQNQLPKAVTHCVEVLRLDPDHSRARTLMRRVRAVEGKKDEGNNAFKSGRLQEAANLYSQALDLIGDSQEEAKGGVIRGVLLSNRATAEVKLGKLEDALADVTASLERQPGNYKAMRTKARILLEKEEYEAAVHEFASALEQAKQDGASDVRALAEEHRKAEVALKRSKTKDHYKTLGIKKDADDRDIKMAYRKLSLVHHPDKGGDEEQFKTIQEAHSVLSDPERRRRYDLGEDEEGTGGGGFGGGMNNMDPEDIAHIFQFMGGGMGGGGMGGGGRRRAGGNPFGQSGFSNGGGFSF